LLTRRGYAVTQTDGTAGIAELAERTRADVVVLDAGTSLISAAHEAGRIEALRPPVGVVLVGERFDALSATPVLEKWASFNELFDAIERVRLGRSQERLPDDER
jgi:hypothetical protein